MSTLELKWKKRQRNVAQTERNFLDFIVDGISLHELVGGDLVGCLGWLAPEQNEIAIRRLLLENEADFPDNRRSLYICPECGDLGCGAVSAIIEQVGRTFIWRDFGFENDYDPDLHLEDYKELGPFVFDHDEYVSVIREVQTKDLL